MHHRVAVGVDRQHGERECLFPFRVALLAIDARNAHWDFNVLLNEPAKGLTRFPARFKEMLGCNAITFPSFAH